MYIYLSERKRRMFLSLSLPQNLSPKKLSSKDLRFLQKNVGNITVPLSLPLIKQQKKLYEKHILFPLINTLSMLAMQKYMFKPTNSFMEKPVISGDVTQPPLYISLWEKCQKYKSINCSQGFNLGFYSLSSSVLSEKLHTTTKTDKALYPSWSFSSGKYKTQSLNAMVAQDVPLASKPVDAFAFPVSKLKKCKTPPGFEFWGIKGKEPLKDQKSCVGIIPFPGKISYKFKKKDKLTGEQEHCYEKPYMGGVLSQPFLYNALCIYTQTVKVKQKSSALAGYGKATYGKVYNDIDFEELGIIKNCLCNPEKVPEILQKFACPPLFVNGQNKYWYCRFLYNREHIKLSINPQIVQNQKINQKVAKSKLLHEKKKIALFYGQIAKKDLYILSKNAQTLPGGFQENMYTLLESRIDVCIHRAGFSKTIAMARQLIRQGLVFVNGKKINSCKVLGKPGDIVTLQPEKTVYNIDFCYKYTTKILYNIYVSQTFNPFLNLAHVSHNKQHAENIKKVPNQNNKEKILRDLWRTKCSHSTHPLWNQYRLDEKQKTTTQVVFKKQKLYGYLYPGFFLYKNLCKKTCPLPFPGNNMPWEKNIRHTFALKGLPNLQGASGKFSDISILLNTYSAFFFKSKCKARNSFGAWKKKEYIFTPVMKNIQNANCASFWGQKPLNLEISHKMASFIYLYPPQKIISPICIDFNALKF